MITVPVSERALTWAKLAARDPALARLERECETIRIDENDDEITLWFDFGFKGAMNWIVGWNRPDSDPILGTTKAYDVAYRHLYGILERRVAERDARRAVSR